MNNFLWNNEELLNTSKLWQKSKNALHYICILYIVVFKKNVHMKERVPLPEPSQIAISDGTGRVIVKISDVQPLLHETEQVLGEMYEAITYSFKSDIVIGPTLRKAEKKDFRHHSQSILSNELILKKEDGEIICHLVDNDGVQHRVNARFY